MDAELLRKACEAAGLIRIPSAAEVYGGGESVFSWWHDGKGNEWPEEDPALPAYVASLLVARVQSVSKRADYLCDLQDIMKGPLAFATDEQRIRAALEALEDE